MKDKKKCCFIHIDRCAGTALRYALAGQYGRPRIYPVPVGVHETKTARPYPCALIDERRFMETINPMIRDKMQLMMGHIDWNITSKLTDDWQIITVLRDPVSQLVSDFNFRKNASPQIWEKYHDVPLTYLQSKGRFRLNRATAYLSGFFYRDIPVNQQALDIAKENLSETVFGIFERMDESIALFNKTLGIKLPIPLPKNNTAHGGWQPNGKEQAVIEDLQRYDIELYDYACSLFVSQLAT